ncbi:endonuclease V isoform X5 [Chroicocephalus ridibundus]|uniref:endonuclease V isoform X5 n=1 Tax=Chroicocephalus ridibundus TaxID=1192867 RepID=UPI002FDD2D01
MQNQTPPPAAPVATSRTGPGKPPPGPRKPLRPRPPPRPRGRAPLPPRRCFPIKLVHSLPGTASLRPRSRGGSGSEQARLGAGVVEEDTEEWQRDPGFAGLERVGGVDLSYIKGDDSSACASLVVLSYPALEVLLVDGNGLLHPRGFGVACHLGVLTDLPCIGVAKNLLQVDGLVRDELHREQIRSLQREGDTFPLTGTSGRALGMALRSNNNSSKPLYISVGHRVCLETAVRLVKSCCRYRIPEPIRQADIRSREYIRKQLCSPLEVTSSGPESGKKEAELDG